MELGKLQVPWHPTNLDKSRQGPIVLGADGGWLDVFSACLSFLSFFLPISG